MQFNIQKKCHIQDCAFANTNSTGHRIHMTMSQRQIPSRHTLTTLFLGKYCFISRACLPTTLLRNCCHTIDTKERKKENRD